MKLPISWATKTPTPSSGPSTTGRGPRQDNGECSKRTHSQLLCFTLCHQKGASFLVSSASQSREKSGLEFSQILNSEALRMAIKRIAAVFFLLASCTAHSGQAQRASVTGRVTTSTGKPLAGISIELYRSRYDANGRATFFSADE